jgi:hypothetical protein
VRLLSLPCLGTALARRTHLIPPSIPSTKLLGLSLQSLMRLINCLTYLCSYSVFNLILYIYIYINLFGSCCLQVINMYNMFFSLNGKKVAEIIVKRCLPQAVFLVSFILKMLSFRLGTLLLCGYLCFDRKWPFILNFSEISLEKREEILKKWSRARRLVPLRIAFVVIKMFCFFNYFSRVMLLIHNGISPSLISKLWSIFCWVLRNSFHKEFCSE